MPEIVVPGEEIEEAARNIQQVIDLFDATSTDLPHLDQALGQDALITAAAKDFKDRWDDGRTQLRDEGQKIIDALKGVLQSFTDTDDKLGDSLPEATRRQGETAQPPGGGGETGARRGETASLSGDAGETGARRGEIVRAPVAPGIPTKAGVVAEPHLRDGASPEPSIPGPPAQGTVITNTAPAEPPVPVEPQGSPASPRAAPTIPPDEYSNRRAPRQDG